MFGCLWCLRIICDKHLKGDIIYGSVAGVTYALQGQWDFCSILSYSAFTRNITPSRGSGPIEHIQMGSNKKKKKRGIFRVSKLDGYLQILTERYLGLIHLVQRVKTSQGWYKNIGNQFSASKVQSEGYRVWGPPKALKDPFAVLGIKPLVSGSREG